MVSCYFICSYFSEGVTYIFWLMKFFSAPHILVVSYLKCWHTGILLHVGAFPQVSREPWLCLNERSRHLKAGWWVGGIVGSSVCMGEACNPGLLSTIIRICRVCPHAWELGCGKRVGSY